MSTALRRTRQSPVSRRRRGFTLWEIATVMLIMAIVATLTAPAYVKFGEERERTSLDVLLKVLRDTRALAIERTVDATLLINPETGHFRVDTASSFGSGPVIEDTLQFAANEGLETDLPRLRYVFRPTGAAFGDSVVVRGSDSTRLVIVDTWSGMAHAIAR
ncbi:MAG TPA: prepilin-type N-terminal cleavage/methylation domain-containing protein [Gemmatimonadaceae bacterium]|nr:prepilin-type N-terminal cleavage/methylation domain-containing protein [Gemmatimonadaceae bacterium]